MNLDAKLIELYGQHLENKDAGIDYKHFVAFQRVLRIASEAELIINQVESINLNGEGK